MLILLALNLLTLAAAPAGTQSLPGAYFPLLAAGSDQVAQALDAEANPSLAKLEARPGYRHFGYAILPPAVLYSKRHSRNSRYKDPQMLALAIRIGDLLASESEKGLYEQRPDSDWDTYMWLEAYRVLQDQLGPARRSLWRRELEKNIAPFAAPAKERLDFPWYQSPFIGTSPNHYSQWAELLYLAGRVFGKKDWENLGARILHRFSAMEQSPDGWWGEHTNAGPAIGYNLLTLSAVAVYCEHSNDPAALEAIRRATNLHKYFTYPDGTPVELINNRNRYWSVSPWSHFAFSHFPAGRGYAEFLTSRFPIGQLSIDEFGRLAQNVLYYHEGPAAPPPQVAPSYSQQLNAPAAIRKTGAWVVALSGIIDTPAPTSQFYLDRQSNFSVFHDKLGLIVSGANSKSQPELATFLEKIDGQIYHLPLSSRLQVGKPVDRLSISFNSFFSDLYVKQPSEDAVHLQFVISGRGRTPEEARLTLQLQLKAGEILETASGEKFLLGTDKLELDSQQMGTSIRHRGWQLTVPSSARLAWPVYPFNPYANAPENNAARAVGTLVIPLQLSAVPGRYIRSKEQEIGFTLTAR